MQFHSPTSVWRFCPQVAASPFDRTAFGPLFELWSGLALETPRLASAPSIVPSSQPATYDHGLLTTRQVARRPRTTGQERRQQATPWGRAAVFERTWSALLGKTEDGHRAGRRAGRPRERECGAGKTGCIQEDTLTAILTYICPS